MKLGVFSLSLSVKDLATSLAFYEKLGFEKVHVEEKYAIVKNGTTIVGMFEGMFEGNMLTFNPGWDHEQNLVEGFTDVRDLRKDLTAAGVDVPAASGDEAASGPASFMITDPDGNVILVDQHV
jgi:catechol 2,3-dioxygenase-like lactoylglutathione lyase family enzyme